MLQYQPPFEVRKFDGGITDTPETPASDRVQTGENLQTELDGTIRSRDGSVTYDFLVPNLTVSGNNVGARISHLVEFKNIIFAFETQEIRFSESSALVEVGLSENLPTKTILSAGALGGKPDTSVVDNRLIITDDQNSTPMVMSTNDSTWTDGAASNRIRGLGLPNFPLQSSGEKFSADVTITPTAPASIEVAAYIYFFAYYYTYVANGKTYEFLGNTALLELGGNNVDSDAAVNHAITNIPIIGTDIAIKQYHKTDIKCRIYRTRKNGIVAYQIAELASTVTLFTDTTIDDEIEFNEVLYRTAGLVNHNESPTFNFCTTTRDTLFVGNVETVIRREKADVITVTKHPNRVLQSIIGDPDNIVNSFFVDLDSEIMGMGNTKGFPIVCTEERTYRIEGRFLATGDGGMVAREISNIVGALNNNSFVNTPKGVYFASKDGFYHTDGYRVTRISSLFDRTYDLLVNRQVKIDLIKGTYDFRQNLVIWSMSNDADTVIDANVDNTILFVFDENKGIRREGSFFTWTNGRQHFRAASLMFEGKYLLRADSRGFLFKHHEDFLSDPYMTPAGVLLHKPGVSTPVQDLDYTEHSITFDYISVLFDFGITYNRKWVSSVKVLADNVTNVNLDIQSASDGTTSFKSTSPVKFTSAWVWGDETLIWGDISAIWDFKGNIYGSRNMPKGHHRCDVKQIRITNADVLIYNDSNDSVTIAGNIATRVGGFTTDLLEYSVEFSSDNGVTWGSKRVITALTPTTFTFDGTLIATGTYDYRISGIQKAQRFKMLSLAIKYAFISNQGTFPESGG